MDNDQVSKSIITAICEQLVDSLVIIDKNGTVISMNNAADRLLDHGYAQNFSGHVKDYFKSVNLTSYPDNKPLSYIKSPLGRALKGEKVDELVYLRVSASSKLRIVHCKGNLVTDDKTHSTVCVFTMRDITDKHEAELALIEQNRYLEVLSQTAVLLGERVTSKSLLKTILLQAQKLVDSRAGYIYVLNNTGTALEVYSGTGVFKKFIGHTLQKNEGLAGTVWATGKSIKIDDYDKWPKRSSAFDKGLFHAGIGVSLRMSNEVIGVIALANIKKDKVFSNRQLKALERFAELASIALDNSRLYQQFQTQNDERLKINSQLRKSQTLLVENEKTLQSRVAQEEMVSNLGVKALSGMEPHDLMNEAVRSLKDTLRVDYTKVLETLPGGKEMILRAGIGWHKEILVDKSTVDTGKNSQAGYTLLSKKPVIVKDLITDKRFSGPPLLRDHNVVSGMSCIIHGKKAPYGVLGVHSIEKRIFTKDDITFLQAVANVIGMAIQRKEIEEKLKNSEDRLSLALKASKMGIWEWDVKTNNLMWSNELRRLYGMPANEEITYEKYISRIHADDLGLTQKTIAKVMKTGGHFSVEHRVVWPDGSTHWVYGSGEAIIKNSKPIRMIGTTISIDERKKTEMRLQESEERFRIMANSAPVLIWTASTDKVRTYFNKVWLKFTGRTAKKELGWGWVEGIHPDDRERYKRIYTKSFDARKPFSVEYRLRNHEGVYRWLLDKGTPRFSAGKKFEGYIGSCVDIDDLKSTVKRAKELEVITEDLREQREELMLINTAKDEFISLASHQLRTPATGVKQFIGMVLEGYVGDLEVPQREMLEYAYESNERQLRVISDLLKVAQVDAGKVSLHKEACDMVALIQDILQEQQNQFESRKQLVVFESDNKEHIAHVDISRMRMVFENIIDNASKYTPDGKKIEIDLRTAEDKMVDIKIKDQGVGISVEDMPKLFQKFSRLDNPLSVLVGGTGLGLYWAKKIISLHDGSVKVTSKPNKGTTFNVKIPAS